MSRDRGPEVYRLTMSSPAEGFPLTTEATATESSAVYLKTGNIPVRGVGQVVGH